MALAETGKVSLHVPEGKIFAVGGLIKKTKKTGARQWLGRGGIKQEEESC